MPSEKSTNSLTNKHKKNYATRRNLYFFHSGGPERDTRRTLSALISQLIKVFGESGLRINDLLTNQTGDLVGGKTETI